MLHKKSSSAPVRRLFLRAKQGILNSSKGSFSGISGSVTKLELKEHLDNISGVRYHNWHILIDDVKCGEYYDVAFAQQCDGFGYILSALLTPEGLRALSDIKISFKPYKTKGTMAILSSHGQTIARGERMPDLDVVIGDDGTQKYDGSTRLAWMLSAVARINACIDRSKDDGDVIF